MIDPIYNWWPLILKKKDQGSFLWRTEPADISLLTWVVIDAPLGITRFVSASIADQFYAPEGAFFYFYYPADEYICYLMTVDELEFYDEIECEDLFAGKDPRERIMIFRLPDYKIGE